MVFLILLPIIIVSILQLFKQSNNESADMINSQGPIFEIDWKTLRGLDLETGAKNENVQKIDGQRVKIAGYIVPLEDDVGQVTEFLLVPSPQACIHVPPPPANQMVHVRMAGGQKVDIPWGPVWLRGRASVKDVGSVYGKSSYFILGENVEKYSE